jgi:transcriptional regulator with XRE-family HTH domain
MDRFRFGRAVRVLRQRRGWRQADLAVRCGVSRSSIGRVERGQLGQVPFARLAKVAEALDGRLELDFRWRGEALDRLIDERHAELVDEVVRLFRAAGWNVDVEVSFSIWGERGSIDVFGAHPVFQVVAVVEVKATVPEAGNTVIGVDRKSRLAPEIARRRGLPCRGVARFLVVADGTTARDRISRHAETFRTAFPAGGRECLAWIRDPSGAPPSGILFLPPRNGHRASARRRPPRPDGPTPGSPRTARRTLDA